MRVLGRKFLTHAEIFGVFNKRRDTKRIRFEDMSFLRDSRGCVGSNQSLQMEAFCTPLLHNFYSLALNETYCSWPWAQPRILMKCDVA